MERSRVDEITRLNSYSTQSAAMFEYDGAMVQDLSTQLFWALARIDVLEAAVMARPRSDELSAGLGASSDTVVYAERPKNFGDCGGGSCDGEMEMVLGTAVQLSPAMQEIPRDVRADARDEDVEMSIEQAFLGDYGVVVKMIGEDRATDMVRDEDDVVGQVASATVEMPAAALEDDGVHGGFGEAVRAGAGADVGQSSVDRGDDGAGDKLAVDTGLMGDEADTVSARRDADEEDDAGKAGGAGGNGADSAVVIESGVDVDRLDLGKMRAGVASVEASQAMEDEMIVAEDDFGGAGGGGAGAAVAARPELPAGFRADVGQSDVVLAHLCLPISGTDMPTDVARGEAIGGAENNEVIGDGEAGAAVLAAGSRADVAQAGLAQAGMTAGDDDGGDAMTSERQQDGMACGGNFGGAGVTMMEAESRADVGQLGFELRAEARSTADVQAFCSRMKWKALEWEQARRWRDEAVARRGAGAASSFPGSGIQVESQAGVARTGVMISNGESGGLIDWSEGQQRGRRLPTRGGRFEGAGGPGGGTPWPELQAESRADVDVAGMLSAESSRGVEDEAFIGKDNFGDAGGADGGSADVGQLSAGVDDRVGGEMDVGTGLVGDAADTARRAREAADGEGDTGRAGGAGGGGADSADVVESGADVGRSGLSLDGIVTGMGETGMVSLKRAAAGDCEIGRAGGAGGDGADSAVVVEFGADVDRPVMTIEGMQ